MNTYAERVARGAAFLDQEYGRGWEDRIDLESFDITDPCGCVLGQLEGGYFTACRRLGLEGSDYLPAGVIPKHNAFDLGFFENTDAYIDSDAAAAWRKLETEWVHLLQARQVAA